LTRFIFYLFVGWGVPFVLMVIPAAAGHIKFIPGASYCFVTGEDNNAWSLTFWFLPVGICLIVGVVLFLLALIRITILFVTIRKLKKLFLLYFRLALFIGLFLVLFVFIFAYYIQYAADEGNITQGYADYYTCLLSASHAVCSLDSSLSNYNLVMLKGWAISSLGLLLFCLFMSWDLLRFWFNVAKGFVIATYRRSPTDFLILAKMVAYKSSTRSITSIGSDSLKVTHVPDEDDSDDEEGDLKLDGVSGESSSSTEEDHSPAPGTPTTPNAATANDHSSSSD